MRIPIILTKIQQHGKYCHIALKCAIHFYQGRFSIASSFALPCWHFASRYEKETTYDQFCDVIILCSATRRQAMCSVSGDSCGNLTIQKTKSSANSIPRTKGICWACTVRCTKPVHEWMFSYTFLRLLSGYAMKSQIYLWVRSPILRFSHWLKVY